MSRSYEAIVVAWLTTRLAVIWIATAVLAAATVFATSCAVGAFKHPPTPRPQVIRTVVYDTVISRAKDTVRVIEEHVGPLTEQRLVRIMCGDTMDYGDDR